jgi:hypothetical protein
MGGRVDIYLVEFRASADVFLPIQRKPPASEYKCVDLVPLACLYS